MLLSVLRCAIIITRAPRSHRIKFLTGLKVHKMPALVTKTIRIREEQELDLILKHKGQSSFLVRELLDIFWKADMPGAEIMRSLGKTLKENGNGMS